jgi:hypothetical protein
MSPSVHVRLQYSTVQAPMLVLDHRRHAQAPRPILQKEFFISQSRQFTFRAAAPRWVGSDSILSVVHPHLVFSLVSCMPALCGYANKDYQQCLGALAEVLSDPLTTRPRYDQAQPSSTK